MTKKGFRSFLPIVFFYMAITAFSITGKNLLERWNISQDVLIIGNIFLLFITLLSYALGLRGYKNPNAHAFVRSVYSSMMMKLFLCVIAVFIYVSLNRATYNKPGLFTCMGLYLVYSFMEVSLLMKLLKGKANE